MSPDPARVQAVFLAAVDIGDPAERARHLDTACAGDAELRARVEALLRAHDQPDSLLDRPPVDPPAPTLRTPDPDSDGPTDSAGEISLDFLAPATRPDSTGRIGHYEVLQVLGKGGFGVVFRAFDDILQRVVAVKVMAPQLAATSPARKRFLREARSSAAIRHENVVQVYEVGEHPLPHLVMEFIPGETLQQRLDRTGPLDVPEVLRIGRQIAEGLAAAHATDLIHRDIKPANILLDGGHHKVKITDFGLARAADDASISQSGIIAGTPMYMAPEQAKGEALDQRADLFSLGSVLYQMVAGRPPFRANGTLAVLKRVADDAPRPIREIIPETPPWLCDVIAKLHAKNPADRSQSAREVADLLAGCEAELKANGKVKSAVVRLDRRPSAPPSRRWRWAAAAGLLLAALAVAEAAGVTHLFRRELAATDPDLAGTGSPLPATGAPQPAPADPSKPNPDPAALADGDRKAAEWVLSVGGKVKVETEEGRQVCATAAELPNGAFRLTSVRLSENDKVTEEGLAAFRGCNDVLELWLQNSSVTDGGLAHFAGCRRLKILDLHRTAVTDGGLAHLKGFDNLDTLILFDLPVTDDGLANFRRCTSLTLLNLVGTRVTDAGLARFVENRGMTVLSLSGTAVTDASVLLFKGRQRLERLELDNTKVTAKGVEELAKALPKCKITWDGGTLGPK